MDLFNKAVFKKTSYYYYCFHVFAILVPTVQTCILLAYYLEEIAVQTPTYVSDLLFSDPTYTAAITVCVILQLFICFAYALLHMGAGRCAEGVFILAACVGWVMICTRYLDEDGKYLSPMHFAGIVVFVVACVLYFCTMLYCMITTTPHANVFMQVVVVILLIASASCWIVFVCCFIYNPNMAWLFEHPAFAIFAAAHAVFFTVDWEQEGRENVNKNDPAKVSLLPPGKI